MMLEVIKRIGKEYGVKVEKIKTVHDGRVTLEIYKFFLNDAQLKYCHENIDTLCKNINIRLNIYAEELAVDCRTTFLQPITKNRDVSFMNSSLIIRGNNISIYAFASEMIRGMQNG